MMPEESPVEREQRYGQEDDVEDVAEALSRASPDDAGQRSLTMGEIKAACGKSVKGLPLLLNVMRSRGRVAFEPVLITRDDTRVTLVDTAAGVAADVAADGGTQQALEADGDGNGDALTESEHDGDMDAPASGDEGESGAVGAQDSPTSDAGDPNES